MRDEFRVTPRPPQGGLVARQELGDMKNQNRLHLLFLILTSENHCFWLVLQGFLEGFVLYFFVFNQILTTTNLKPSTLEPFSERIIQVFPSSRRLRRDPGRRKTLKTRVFHLNGNALSRPWMPEKHKNRELCYNREH